ncbi:MAG TPA: arylsulfatase, partial [Flavilitoribacter sp.]|nr:arylsulfatase [Flavilitoribacter sp.]
YGILTGRYCFRSALKKGVLGGYDPPLIEPDRPTLGGILQRAGYHTACIGKWHLGLDWPRKDTSKALVSGDPWSAVHTDNVDYHADIGGGPVDRGFNYSYIIPASLDIAPYCYIENRRLTQPMTGHIAGQNAPRGVFWRESDLQEGFELGNTLDHLTKKAAGYIRERASTGEPFFLYFPMTAPHTPWLPSAPFRGKSGAGDYGDFVAQVDHCAGLILKALQESGLAENTLVIFTSDNGAHWLPSDQEKYGHRANGPLRGMKSDVWEGGHRVPFIVRWPRKVLGGVRNNQLICLTDMLATLTEAAGADRPPGAGEDSHSFLKALLREDQPGPGRPPVILHSVDGVFAIRRDEWILIDHPGSGGWSYPGQPGDPQMQLYNLDSDRGEQDNLLESRPELAAELKTELEKLKSNPSR